jgi:hypothetical protein
LKLRKDLINIDNFFDQIELEAKLKSIIPNGYMRFKTALGTETDVNVTVKISGPICIFLPNEQKLFLPSQDKMTKQDWFKSLVKNHGQYQGLFQRNVKIEIPGEAEPENKLNW